MTSKTKTPKQKLHQPVLLEQVIEILKPVKGETYLDLTAGYGGHAKEIIKIIGQPSLATLVDRDNQAIASLDTLSRDGARIIKSDFASAAKLLLDSNECFDIILMDLGVSSPQLDNAERGFSFKNSGLLDMRMDRDQLLTAADIVNSADQESLTRIIKTYGEEPKAKVIANAIISNRPLQSTVELADVVASAIRGRWKRIHPATRTFQALRIFVNDELKQISDTLEAIPGLLNPGGRVAMISFHSLEDRLVKNFLKTQSEAGFEAELSPLTKKPISGATYDVHNPRARSAKLRAAVKIKNERMFHGN